MANLGSLLYKKHGKFFKNLNGHMEKLGDVFFNKDGKCRKIALGQSNLPCAHYKDEKIVLSQVTWKLLKGLSIFMPLLP